MSEFFLKQNAFLTCSWRFLRSNTLEQLYFKLVEVWSYLNGPSKLAAPISSKQFFGFQLFFQCTRLVICLNLTDLSKKIHFVYSKLNLRPKHCLLEIGAANLEGPFIYDQTSKINLVLETYKKIQKNAYMLVQYFLLQITYFHTNKIRQKIHVRQSCTYSV